MPAIKGGPDARFAQVDRTTGGIRTVASPLGFGKTSANVVGALGHYHVSVATGTLAATLAAAARVFSFRWTDSSKLAVITRVQAKLITLTAFPADQQIRLDAFTVRTFTTDFTDGTSLTKTTNSFKKRASMATTSIGTIRVATTAALSGQTLTADANAFAQGIGTACDVNVAAGTAMNIQVPPVLDWRADVGSGVYPLVLAQNEGFVIQNGVLWGATGTGVVAVAVEWAEVEDYMGMDGDSQ